MAAVEVLSTASAMASSLAPTEVPIKLRCAICNNLAVMAYRLPCCDQSICETCQSTLPASCPVCEHTPLSKEDCKPNKPLRTTIMVFLRTEKKKREMLEGQTENTNPPTPTSASIPADTTTHQNGVVTSKSPERDGHICGSVGDVTGQAQHVEPQLDAKLVGAPPSTSINEPTEEFPEQAPSRNPENSDTPTEAEQAGGVKDGEKPADESGTHVKPNVQSGQWGASQGPQPMMGAIGASFDGPSVGFSNMGWNGQGDFNPMMNPMLNVMPNAGWGSFPNMMGMPGMNMDPLAMSQGMYGGGFGGQGMDMSGIGGMNGMNMGMGMGFNAGQGGYDGGWNGQSTWNGAQDKYNPNTIGGNAGGMVGDFGANSGFHPAAGGYNLQTHGNYSQIPQPQYQNNDYQDSFRGQSYVPRGGRGRGRGYGYAPRGRGGYGYGYDGNNAPFQQQLPLQYQQQGDLALQQPRFGNEMAPLPNGTDDVSNLQAAGSVTPKGLGNVEGNENEMSETQSEAKTLVEPIIDAAPVDVSNADEGNDASGVERSVSEQAKPRPDADTTATVNLDSGIMDNGTTEFAPPPLGPTTAFQGQLPQEFPGRGRAGVVRGTYRGAPDVRGGFRGRGSGTWPNSSGVPGHSPNQATPVGQFPVIAPTEPKPVQGLGVPGAPSAPKAFREGYANRPRGRGGFGIPIRGGFECRGGFAGPVPTGPKSEEVASRPRSLTRSRSRSPDRSESSHRRHRHRSRSRSVDDSEREKRQEKRRRHSHRERGDDNGESDLKDDKDTPESTPVERPGSRSPTPSGKRSSHRSSRYGKDRDRRSSHRHRDSHRSHRERSRGRDRDHDRDKDRNRDRSRDRSKERRRRRRRSRSPGAPDAPESVLRVEPETTETQDVKADVDRDRKGLRDSHTSRQRDRKSRSGRDRSESPKPDPSNHDRRGSHTIRRRDDASSSVASTPTVRESRDKPNALREPSRNGRKPRGSDIPPPKPTPEDAHNREREERNRERLLKEQQRREELNKERERKDMERKRGRVAVDDDDAGAGDDGDEDRHHHRRHKRHRRRNTGGADDDVGDGGQERQRRLSYKYEDEESDEARAQRVENEREAARWG